MFDFASKSSLLLICFFVNLQDMANRPGAAGSGNAAGGAGGGGRVSQFKLVLLGESAVGKSSLVLRFVKGQFHEFQVCP